MVGLYLSSVRDGNLEYIQGMVGLYLSSVRDGNLEYIQGMVGLYLSSVRDGNLEYIQGMVGLYLSSVRDGNLEYIQGMVGLYLSSVRDGNLEYIQGMVGLYLSSVRDGNLEYIQGMVGLYLSSVRDGNLEYIQGMVGLYLSSVNDGNLEYIQGMVGLYLSSVRDGNLEYIQGMVGLYLLSVRDGNLEYIQGMVGLYLSSVRDGNLEYIQGMLKSKKPPDVNKTDEFGNTALHIAAQSNQKEVAVLLLQSGVNVTAKNAKDQTAIDFAYNTPMKQLLSVTPVKDIPKLPHHWEGILLKKSRFLGFQALWVVLERGVLSYFKTRGDASSGVKRKGMKYLDNATVLGRESEPSEFVIHYSDGTRHTFSFPPKELDLVVKQKLFNILKEHITFSTHYTSQGKQLDGNNEEIISIRSIEDSFKTAEAHHNLLERKLIKCLKRPLMCSLIQQVQVRSINLLIYTPVPRYAGLVGMMEQIEDVMNLSKEMTVSLKQCLTQFKQQEEIKGILNWSTISSKAPPKSDLLNMLQSNK
ncbi:ORP1_2 [Mytilus edulis]|uniref:OSBPL1_2 n=1 Tax=Mytilus edulis TaxID=6550 RepID=A0A8S3PXM9_MYTED|nr:ORP1_2 [Mytilus edulis]